MQLLSKACISLNPCRWQESHCKSSRPQRCLLSSQKASLVKHIEQRRSDLGTCGHGTGKWEGVRPAKASMMVGMDVADPDALQASDDPVRFRAVAAPQLSVGPLPAVQQYSTLQGPPSLLLCCSILLITQQKEPHLLPIHVTTNEIVCLGAASRQRPI